MDIQELRELRKENVLNMEKLREASRCIRNAKNSRCPFRRVVELIANARQFISEVQATSPDETKSQLVVVLLMQVQNKLEDFEKSQKENWPCKSE